MRKEDIHEPLCLRYEELLRDAGTAKLVASRNVMMDERLRADYRAGYWEVTFFHTKALGRIPKDMHR